MFLSSSAKIRIILSIASPIAVEVSNCSFIEINVTLWSFNSWYIAAKSRRFRETRSTFQTIRCENSPDLTRDIISWKCGRSVFFAEYPSSSKTTWSSSPRNLQYSFNFFRWNGRLSLSTWYLVETRTYKAAFFFVQIFRCFFILAYAINSPFPQAPKKGYKKESRLIFLAFFAII